MNISGTIPIQPSGRMIPAQATDEKHSPVAQHCAGANYEPSGSVNNTAKLLLNSCKDAKSKFNIDTVTENASSTKKENPQKIFTENEWDSAVFSAALGLLLEKEQPVKHDIIMAIIDDFQETKQLNGLKFSRFYHIREIVEKASRQIDLLNSIPPTDSAKNANIVKLLGLIEEKEMLLKGVSSTPVTNQLENLEKKDPELYALYTWLHKNTKCSENTQEKILEALPKCSIKDPSLFIKMAKICEKNLARLAGRLSELFGKSTLKLQEKQELLQILCSIGCELTDLPNANKAAKVPSQNSVQATSSIAEGSTGSIQASASPIAEENLSTPHQETVNTEQNSSSSKNRPSINPQFPKPDTLEFLQKTIRQSSLRFLPQATLDCPSYGEDIRKYFISQMEIFYNNANNSELSEEDHAQLNDFKKKHPVFYSQLCMLFKNENFSKNVANVEDMQKYIYSLLDDIRSGILRRKTLSSDRNLLVAELNLFDMAFALFGQGDNQSSVTTKLINSNSITLKQAAEIAKFAHDQFIKLGSGVLA